MVRNEIFRNSSNLFSSLGSVIKQSWLLCKLQTCHKAKGNNTDIQEIVGGFQYLLGFWL